MPGHTARHGFAQAVALERLGQIIDDPLAEALDCRTGVVGAGRDDHRRIGMFAAQLIGEPQAIVARHVEVAQRDGRGRGGQQLERLVGARREGDGIAARLQPPPHEVPNTGLVVHDDHGTVQIAGERRSRGSSGSPRGNAQVRHHASSIAACRRRAIVPERSSRSRRR